jgi:two-component system NtrC family sensor kinase
MVEERTGELKQAFKDLQDTQIKLIQSEKMASLGQLAAGVAHEINNPMGFISSNLSSLEKYFDKITAFAQAQDAVLHGPQNDDGLSRLEDEKKKLKIDFIMQDGPDLIRESLDGAERVRKIVQDLKGFSRLDDSPHNYVDINDCIDVTLNIIWSELKYKTTVKKEYGDIPKTTCYVQQLNQVFMNIIMNAAHAIHEKGEITIKTWDKDGSIFVAISDTGRGIPQENLKKIFDPFFTTKEVGKGTGLGLSIVYDIVKKHGGDISVKSSLGKGTTFTIRIPIVDHIDTNSEVLSLTP